MPSYRIVPLALTLLLCPAPVLAQSGPDDASIIVSAARFEQNREESGQSVSVITRQDIERSQAVALSDLLAQQPGIAIARNGGIGTTTSLFLRGADSDQTLVVIDGVRVNDPSSPAGSYDFGHLLVAQIDHVEVVRGASSLAWGSQALGGVIWVTTRQPQDHVMAQATAEYGYGDTAFLRSWLTAPIGSAALSLGGSYLESDGISQARNGEERDGYRNSALSARLTMPLTQGLALDLAGSYSDAETQIDGFPAPDFILADTADFQLSEQWIGSASLLYQTGDLANRMSVSRYQNDRGQYDPASSQDAVFSSKGLAKRYEYQGLWQASQTMKLSFGVEREDSHFAAQSYGVGETASARMNSAYVLASAHPAPSLSLTAGLRYDHHSSFGSQVTLGADGAWHIGDMLILRAAYGEGFKAPSLYQLNSQDYGNRALRPTHSRSYEIGVSMPLAGEGFQLSANAWRRNSTNTVDFVSCFANSDPRCTSQPYGFYDNILAARAQGVEIDATARPLSGLTLKASYTLTQTRNTSAGHANFGNRLARRPVDMAVFSADWSMRAGVQLGATMRLVGDAFDNGANSVRLDDYILADLRAAFAITDQLELFGRVENLFDQRYQTAAGYGTYPLSAHAGIRAKLR